MLKHAAVIMLWVLFVFCWCVGFSLLLSVALQRSNFPLQLAHLTMDGWAETYSIRIIGRDGCF
jgi:hypothetical protein